ncbi:hypothetical protein KFE80_09240 [bacterium SCSIO 12696]|nr:hypothetical protein KFE80_09240 [bacterium SCSIO 12696]
MKIVIPLLALFALCTTPGLAAEKTYLIDGNDRDGTRRITPLDDGGFVLTGWTNGNADKKDGEGWLVRVDKKGKIRWQQRFPNQLTTGRGSQASGHAVDSDGTIIMALEEYRSKGPYRPDGSNGRGTLMRFSADGKLLHKKVMGSSGINVLDIIKPVGDGTYLIAGETTSPIQKGYDGWIFKTDADFNVIWDTKVGGFGAERFNDVLFTDDGGFLAAGRTTTDEGGFRAWIVKLDSNGKVQWQKRYREDQYENTIREILPVKDGGWVFTGFTKNHPSDPDTRNAWIARIDTQGELLWDKAIGGAGSDVTYVMTQTNDGTYLAAGSTQNQTGGTRDAYVIAFDASGKVLWERTFGKPETNEVIRGITPYKKSGFVLSGNYQDPRTGQQDSMLIKVDKVKTKAKKAAAPKADNTFLIGAEGRDGVRRNTPLDDGGFVLSGWTEAGASRKEGKAWIVRIDKKGKIVWKNVHPNELGNNRGSHMGAHTLDVDGNLVYNLEEFRSKNGKPPGITGRSTLHRATLDGKILHKKIMGGAGTDIIDIMIPQGDGTIVMGGETTSPDGKSYSGWIFKVDKDFNVIWDRKLGGLGYERFNGLIQTADGGFLAVGRTSGRLGRYRGKLWRLDAEGNVIWEQRYREDEYYASSFREGIELDDGSFIFNGWVFNEESNSEDPRNMIIGRVTAGGTLMWAKTLGGPGDDISFGLIQTDDGTILAAGQEQSSIRDNADAWVVAFDKNGDILWQKRHGYKDTHDVIRGLTAYKKNGYMLTGNAENKKTGEHDALLVVVEDINK